MNVSMLASDTSNLFPTLQLVPTQSGFVCTSSMNVDGNNVFVSVEIF